jgi:hypothetical protein
MPGRDLSDGYSVLHKEALGRPSAQGGTNYVLDMPESVAFPKTEHL